MSWLALLSEFMLGASKVLGHLDGRDISLKVRLKVFGAEAKPISNSHGSEFALVDPPIDPVPRDAEVLSDLIDIREPVLRWMMVFGHGGSLA